MPKNLTEESSQYRILVNETFDHHIGGWFGDLTILPQENGMTILVGTFADQSALRGLLEQLWNLNITVISVERIDNEK